MAHICMDFNLKVGMKDDEFLNAVCGKIAGENKNRTREVLMTQQLSERVNYQPRTYARYGNVHHDNEPFKEKEIYNNPLLNQLAPDFQVMEVNNELQLALVAKRKVREKPLRISYEYFMMGMDRDTQNMFIHPLHGMPDNFNLDSAYSWSDRVNQGFRHSDRVQGDLLVRLEQLVGGKPYTDRTHFLRTSTCDFKFELDGTTFFFDGESNLARQSTQVSGLTWNQDNKIFTNHTLKHDGKQYKLNLKDEAVLTPMYIISGATYVMLEHEEHPRYVQRIPDRWVALITAQRGQDSYTQPQRNLS